MDERKVKKETGTPGEVNKYQNKLLNVNDAEKIK